jgi:hypothetical protein
MLSNFKDLVSHLYKKWKDSLMQSLDPTDGTYFEAICLKTATEDDLIKSLYNLSYFLAQESGQNVLYSTRGLLRLRTSNSDQFFFGRGVLGPLLKAIIMKFHCRTFSNIFI